MPMFSQLKRLKIRKPEKWEHPEMPAHLSVAAVPIGDPKAP
jgi:hypothetical protein